MPMNPTDFGGALSLDGYGPGFFRIGGQVHRGPVIATAQARPMTTSATASAAVASSPSPSSQTRPAGFFFSFIVLSLGGASVMPSA